MRGRVGQPKLTSIQRRVTPDCISQAVTFERTNLPGELKATARQDTVTPRHRQPLVANPSGGLFRAGLPRGPRARFLLGSAATDVRGGGRRCELPDGGEHQERLSVIPLRSPVRAASSIRHEQKRGVRTQECGAPPPRLFRAVRDSGVLTGKNSFTRPRYWRRAAPPACVPANGRRPSSRQNRGLP